MKKFTAVIRHLPGDYDEWTTVHELKAVTLEAAVEQALVFAANQAHHTLIFRGKAVYDKEFA